MKIFRKITFIFVLLITFSFSSEDYIHIKNTVLVIDVAHGGFDKGTQTNAISEKDLVLQIAQRIEESNRNMAFDIHFTRNDDNFVSLQERTTFINSLNPDIVLSLHANYDHDAAKKGMQLVIAENSKFFAQSEAIAKKIQSRLLEKNFSENIDISTQEYYLLKRAKAPAISIGLGYLSNSEDLIKLTSLDEQHKIASIILSAIGSL